MLNSPGWAVALKGDRFDLEDLEQWLKPPFDPWMELLMGEDGALTRLLRSKSWASLTEASDVTRDAERLVERLHGAALLLQSDAQPVQVGEVILFDQAGKRKPIIFAASGTIRICGGRVRGRVSSNAPPPPPTESEMQKWSREADTDDTRSELLSHVARADNWFDLYKAMELARRIAGVNAVRVLAQDESEWRRIWQTANCYRHAPDPVKFPLPSPPADFEPSRAFLLRVLPRFLV